jgi:DnaJ family protein A protein 3
VQVPAGVSDGQTLRVPAEGSDVYVILRVADSDDFERDGYDVHSNVAITFTQAVLGGSAYTPGLNGTLEVKIPSGIQSHHRIRLAGRGISHLNGYGNGDHYVHVKIKIPKNLSQEQKDLIVQYAMTEKDVNGRINGIEGREEKEETNNNKPIKQDKGFLQKLKDMFWTNEQDEEEKSSNKASSSN